MHAGRRESRYVPPVREEDRVGPTLRSLAHSSFKTRPSWRPPPPPSRAYRSRARPADPSTRPRHPASGSPVAGARARSPPRTLTRAMSPRAPATGGCSRQPSTRSSTHRRGLGW